MTKKEGAVINMGIKFEKIISYGPSSNVYLLLDPPQAVIIDAGLPEFLSDHLDYIKEISKKVRRVHVIFTHCHFDHVYGLEILKKEFRVETYAHELDAEDIRIPSYSSLARTFGARDGFEIDHELKEGDRLEIGDIDLKIWHLPGHTDGSIGILWEDRIFTGDLIFLRGIGRSDLPTGDEEELRKSVMRVMRGNFKEMYPGHGSTVVDVRANNEYLLRNFLSEGP